MTWTLSAFADEAGPTCDEQVATLTQAGIHHVDLRSIDGYNISVLPREHAEIVQQKLVRAGIACAMLGSPIGKIDVADDMEIDIRKMHHLALLADVFHCRVVRIFSYFNQKANWPRAAYQEESLTRVGRLKKLAQELGLVLYHENESHIFGDQADDCLVLAREFRDAGPVGGGGVFKTIFDFGNFNAGRENVWEAWLKLREHTDAIHLKDNKWAPAAGGEGGQLQHVPVGLGQGYVKEILVDAVNRRFSGPVSLEPHLLHSAAVAATGPSGVPNQSYAGMSLNEAFQVAARAAKETLAWAGAAVV